MPLIDLDGVRTPASSCTESEEDDGPAFIDPEACEDRERMTPIGLIQCRRYEVPMQGMKCEHCRKKSKSEMIPFKICNYCYAKPSYHHGKCFPSQAVGGARRQKVSTGNRRCYGPPSDRIAKATSSYAVDV